MRALALIPLLLACTACGKIDQGGAAEIAQLRAELAALKSQPAPTPSVELGQQMLELQIRHARLWQAGEARNWMLTQFQLAELRESFKGVVELNGDHAALQPKRLAEVLPAMMDAPLAKMQEAVDAQDAAGFEAAYDAVSGGCNRCHEAADHGFLVIQRPQTPVLDNLRSAPLP